MERRTSREELGCGSRKGATWRSELEAKHYSSAQAVVAVVAAVPMQADERSTSHMLADRLMRLPKPDAYAG